MRTLILEDGIRLHAFEEKRFKSEYLSLNFLRPSADCPVGESVLLPSVMAQSNARYPDNMLFCRALEESYNTSFSCRLFRVGDTRIQPFAVSWLSDRFVPDGFGTEDFALGFLKDTLLFPRLEDGAFPAEELSKQIRNRIDDLHAEKNNKQRYAIKKCIRAMCEDDPFSIPLGGSEQALGQVSSKSLFAYYSSLLEDAPIELYYFGRKPAEEMADRISTLFSPLIKKKGDVHKDRVCPPSSDVRRLTERANAQQSVLCLGYKTTVTLNHPLHPAQVVMKEILSDSPISLLFTNVREKESICYYCSALSETGKGLFLISAGIDKRNTARAEDAILRQIEKMKQGDFADDLIHLAKKALISAYKDLYDSPAHLEAWYLRRNLAGRWDSPLDMAKQVEMVSKEQIVACANALTLDTVFLLEGQKGGESDD